MIIPEYLSRIGGELVALQAEIVKPVDGADGEKPVEDLIKDAVLLGKIEAMRTILEDIRRSLK